MRLFILSILFIIFSIRGFSQKVNIDDYKRAQSFLWENVNNNSVLNMYTKFNFFPDSSGFWFLNYSQSEYHFEQLKFSSLIKKPLFDHTNVALLLTVLLNKPVSADSLPFKNLEYVSHDTLNIKLKDQTFQITGCARYIKKIEPIKKVEANILESKSPDGKWIAYCENYNLFIKSTENSQIFQLSTNGKENYEYGSFYEWDDLIKGENGKRTKRLWVNWSNDSKWLQSNICDLRSAQKMYLLDYSVDSLYRPELYSYYRGSPGDTNMVYYHPLFYNVGNKSEIQTSLKKRTHINDYDFHWIENKDRILVIDKERGFKKLNFLVVDFPSGNVENLFSETSNTNVGGKLHVRLLKHSAKFIFTSERSGWNHIYGYDFESGKIKAITKGEYVVTEIYAVDEEKGRIFFNGLGKEKDENPYHNHLYSVSIDGVNLKHLTPVNGNHKITLSPDGLYFIDAHSTVNIPTSYNLCSTRTGDILTKLTKIDVSKLVVKGWQSPQVFEATAGDGKTKIYGALWKPANFNPAQKYPIIDNSYTGPHTQVFPEEFEQGLWGDQALAELGFIIIKVNGMGTAHRSKSFADVSYKNMGQNLKDHVLAIQQLAEKYSWIDTDRVGIFGHSAGGFDAGHALLEFPNFYKVAVATSADHDFRMEKAWWPEMYMGWPVDSAYHKVSNITMAPNLKGKLLIIHGSLDENVNPSATFKLAEALIKANKDFDMLILPSQHHAYKEPHKTYVRKKTWNYFVEHLLQTSPIWDFD